MAVPTHSYSCILYAYQSQPIGNDDRIDIVYKGMDRTSNLIYHQLRAPLFPQKTTARIHSDDII